MKKKVVSILLASAMVMTLLAGCGKDKKEETVTPADDTTPVEDTVVPATGEEVPEAKYYWNFDGAADGATVKVNDFENAEATTVETRIINDDTKSILYTDGVLGQCAYLDGSYGLEMDITPVGDTFTLSFWMNAARLSDYGPVIQFGSDLYSANTAAKWINFTKTTFPGEDTFPVVWSRDEAKDIWPWFDAQDNQVFGKKEWAHVVLVADATDMTDDGLFVNAKLYINGELQTKSDAEGNVLQNQLTPGVFSASDSFHFFIGINCWDTIFKGGIDELYIFDQALTAGQVKTLYDACDGSKELVAPETAEVVEEAAPIVAPETIETDAAAIETIGTVARDTAWWSEFTNAVELADGTSKTVTFNNYSDGGANWDNYVVAFINTATTSDLAPSADNYTGYAEYAVVRSDLYGWGDASYAGTFEGSWGTDWTAFAQAMTDATVKLTLTRNAGEITMDAVITDAAGVEYTSKSVITSTLTADAPCYFFITGEKCYIEVLSVE